MKAVLDSDSNRNVGSESEDDTDSTTMTKLRLKLQLWLVLPAQVLTFLPKPSWALHEKRRLGKGKRSTCEHPH